MSDNPGSPFAPQTLFPWSQPQTLYSRPREEQGRSTTGAPRGPNVVEIFDRHHYAYPRGSIYLSVPTSSLRLLDAPVFRRNYLMVRNASATANLYIEFDNQATLFSTLKLTAGQIVFFDVVVPQGEIYAIADAASAAVAISFSNVPDLPGID